jgi:hypothetical protein
VTSGTAELGTAGAVLGTLSVPGRDAMDDGAIEVAVSPDGQFAFATLEYADKAVVFNLGKALRAGFGAAERAGTGGSGSAVDQRRPQVRAGWVGSAEQVRQPSLLLMPGPRLIGSVVRAHCPSWIP